MTTREAVARVVDALRAADITTHTDPTTAPVGPCAVVGVPSITAQDGVCAHFDYELTVRLLSPSAAARAQLLDLIDTAAAAVAAAGMTVSSGRPATFDLAPDATVDGYDLTLDL